MEQTSEPYSDMEGMLELSGYEFKITMINVIGFQWEKWTTRNMGNVSIEM